MGVKTTVEAQGMWICWSGALKFHQNWIKHKKRRKNMPVFAVFEHFWRFFNFGRILAHQTTKFTFLEVYCFFWHPTHLWMWLSSARKKLGQIWQSVMDTHTVLWQLCIENKNTRVSTVGLDFSDHLIGSRYLPTNDCSHISFLKKTSSNFFWPFKNCKNPTF